MISLLVPTRKRPENVKRFTQSVLDTVLDLNNVEICWYMDLDDMDTVVDVMAQALIDDHLCHRVVLGPRITLSDCWNKAMVLASGDIFGLLGDDVIFDSKNWDLEVTEAFDRYKNKIALVYGYDGFRNGDHGSHPFVHENWVNALGRVSPPYFSADMNDVWLNEIAEGCGVRCYLPNMRTLHMHPDNPSLGVKIDQTHIERMARRDNDKTHELYDSTPMYIERKQDLYKLRAAIQKESE